MADDRSAASRVTEQEALRFHSEGQPGKIEIVATKPLTTQQELSLAYSPGVAYPCLHIQRDPACAYDYTAKGNLVAVISNGTAVLGLGDLGALAAKPVMEGKAVLFKRFAGIDAVDLEVATRDVDEFVNCVRYLHPAFGGINLEDIKAPECFIIEQRLRELLDIPVFHDDQHGTAIIATAALLNALDLTGRELKKIRMVVNGAGAAAIACVELLKTMGLPHDRVLMCDTKGVIYEGRREGMNQWKSAHAVNTKRRTLAEAMEGADVFFGLSTKDVVSQAMVRSMADRPMVAAMANPDPEIAPEDVRAVRPDAIMCTGRSDYPNQINNVLGFPYIFRGALDVRASTINDAMKIAAAHALAKLAREDVPDEVAAAYSGQRLRYGPDYIVPTPFDPRLISTVPPAVAKAAVDSGVARRPISDLGAYRRGLMGRLDPTAASLQRIFDQVRANPRRVVFAEGEEEKTIRAALSFRDNGYGTPVLIARHERITETLREMGFDGREAFEIHNPRLAANKERYISFLYERLQRSGALHRDVRADGKPGPQRLCRLHGRVRRCRRARDRRDAQLLHRFRGGGARDRPARGPLHLRLRAAAFARPVDLHRRHHRPCATLRRRACRHRHAVGRACASHDGAGAARSTALALELRQSRPRAGAARQGGGGAARRAPPGFRI